MNCPPLPLPHPFEHVKGRGQRREEIGSELDMEFHFVVLRLKYVVWVRGNHIKVNNK